MIDPANATAGWLHQALVLPILYRLGAMQWDDIAYGWTLFAVYGVAQVALTLAICLPLERAFPVERHTPTRLVATDVLYTLLARIGVLPLVTFVLFYNLQVALGGFLADRGIIPPTLETLCPALLGHPILTFLLYALILDFAEYWRHRLSHRFDWWYALHAVHHAQEHMTFWSDDRNHLLDDIIGFAWFLAIGLAIGVPPMQFPLLILFLRFLESLSHANARIHFGRIGERLLVSPRFHRAHHGRNAAGRRSANYGAIFPFWDMIFRTADFRSGFVATGDATAPRAMAEGGWLAQQTAGLRRLFRHPA
jgi:sterol desaturase/sphingolipid hydroxylase (fatty acid hydroxylase superfamily)